MTLHYRNNCVHVSKEIRVSLGDEGSLVIRACVDRRSSSAVAADGRRAKICGRVGEGEYDRPQRHGEQVRSYDGALDQLSPSVN
jgi:hypothetical protein